MEVTTTQEVKFDPSVLERLGIKDIDKMENRIGRCYLLSYILSNKTNT